MLIHHSLKFEFGFSVIVFVLGQLIIPQPGYVKADQEISTLYFCTTVIGITKRTVFVIQIILLLYQVKIVTYKYLE